MIISKSLRIFRIRCPFISQMFKTTKQSISWIKTLIVLQAVFKCVTAVLRFVIASPVGHECVF